MSEDKRFYVRICTCDLTNKFMILDNDDNCYDVYLLNIPVKLKEVREIIESVKMVLKGTWTLQDIEKILKQELDVKEVINFDYGIDNVIDVNSWEV